MGGSGRPPTPPRGARRAPGNSWALLDNRIAPARRSRVAAGRVILASASPRRRELLRFICAGLRRRAERRGRDAGCAALAGGRGAPGSAQGPGGGGAHAARGSSWPPTPSSWWTASPSASPLTRRMRGPCWPPLRPSPSRDHRRGGGRGEDRHRAVGRRGEPRVHARAGARPRSTRTWPAASPTTRRVPTPSRGRAGAWWPPSSAPIRTWSAFRSPPCASSSPPRRLYQPMSGPHESGAQSRSAPALPGRFRAFGGHGGPFEAPHLKERPGAAVRGGACPRGAEA